MSFSSESTLFFGVFVRAMPLAMAAEAWKEVKPPFLALDMLAARRRKGTLSSTSAGTSFVSLPAEVLDAVKQQLSRLKLAMAVDRFVRSLHARFDPDLDAVDFDDDECTSGLFTFAHFRKCELCLEHRIYHESFWQPRCRDMEACLRDFRLCLVSTNRHTDEQYDDFDADASAGIGLCLLQHPSSPSFPSLDYSDWPPEGDSHETIRFSPEVFEKAQSEAHRFRRFLAVFPLDVVDTQPPVVVPPTAEKALHDSTEVSGVSKSQEPRTTMAKAGDARMDAQRLEKEEQQKSEARRRATTPSWMLWTQMHNY